MFKTMIFAFVAVMAIAAVFASPMELESDNHHQEFEASVRLPRATCDLLSAFGVADSACAAHCIGLRKKGGWCERGVCHCRN